MSKQGEFINQMIEYLNQQYIDMSYNQTANSQNNHKPKVVKNNASRKQLVVGESCPQCSPGQLVLKTVKTGKNSGRQFIGCSNYPKCNTFSWADPS